MTTPTTPAGLEHVAAWLDVVDHTEATAAIENEAAAAARTALLDELEAAVGNLPGYDRGDELVLKRDAVLAEIRRRRRTS